MPEPAAPRDPVRDADLIRLFEEIKRLSLSLYPFMKEDDTLDPMLCLMLGEVGGICSAAIERYRREHPGFI